MKNLIILVFALVFSFENANCAINQTIITHPQKQFILSSTFLNTSISEENTMSDELDIKNVESDSDVKDQIKIGGNENLFGCLNFSNIVIPAVHPLHYDLPPPKFIFLR